MLQISSELYIQLPTGWNIKFQFSSLISQPIRTRFHGFLYSFYCSQDETRDGFHAKEKSPYVRES